ncbi:MAG: alpha/beta hydrolase [Bacteroidota bacterium]
MKDIYHIMEDISIASNITYKKIDSLALQLDVYFPAKKLGAEPWDELSNESKPTLIYFHGGGWVEGDRISRFLGLLPYLEKGWCVVNVDYRLLDKTHLIGSLNDCIDAINWVKENASTYKFDVNKIYLSGESAGGHLALLAGMIETTKVNGVEIHKRESEIQGIINWYGITEMETAIAFWDDSSYTKEILNKWTGNERQYLKTTSPINHITANTPPILSIHGDEDINVRVEQATSLHTALEAQGVKNKLLQISGKKHGNFSAIELNAIFKEIWQFIK